MLITSLLIRTLIFSPGLLGSGLYPSKTTSTLGVHEIIQPVRGLAAKPVDPSSTPRIHMLEGQNQLLQAVLWSPHKCHRTHPPTHHPTHYTCINKCNKHFSKDLGLSERRRWKWNHHLSVRCSMELYFERVSYKKMTLHHWKGTDEGQMERGHMKDNQNTSCREGQCSDVTEGLSCQASRGLPVLESSLRGITHPGVSNEWVCSTREGNHIKAPPPRTIRRATCNLWA